MKSVVILVMVITLGGCKYQPAPTPVLTAAEEPKTETYHTSTAKAASFTESNLLLWFSLDPKTDHDTMIAGRDKGMWFLLDEGTKFFIIQNNGHLQQVEVLSGKHVGESVWILDDGKNLDEAGWQQFERERQTQNEANRKRAAARVRQEQRTYSITICDNLGYVPKDSVDKDRIKFWQECELVRSGKQNALAYVEAQWADIRAH